MKKISQKKIAEYTDVLSVNDVQEILRIGRKQVYKLIEEKKLFAVKPGRSFCISKKSLLLYVDGNTQDSCS